MRNPLENEEAAFRFVLATIAFFAPIVIAAWISTWLGLVVLVLATAVVVYRIRRSTTSRSDATEEPAPRATVADTRRILVVGSRTLSGERLREALVLLSEGVPEDVLLACPTAADGLGHERVGVAVDELRAAGVNARGVAYEGDVLSAFQQALQSFTPDEVIISTREDPSEDSRAALLEAIRDRFGGPVTLVAETER